MAISYPLSLPSVLRAGVPITARTVSFGPAIVVGESVAPFSLSRQTYEHQGAVWVIEYHLPLLTRPDAAPWIAVLTSAHGKSGNFLAGPPDASAALAGGSATVNGDSQTGYTLAVTVSGTIKAGDYFQLGSGSSARVFMCLQDRVGSGDMEIFPRINSAYSSGASLDFTFPVGVFHLIDNNSNWDVNEAGHYNVSFRARSVV